jgi:hypothetical protein
MRETELYAPVKRFLEAQGYAVKAEVLGCDAVAVRGAEPPVIVELKTGFSLQLLLQGVDRLAISDAVYLAVPAPKRGGAADWAKLCRRLGLGLITVASSGSLEVLADPLPYAPRKSIQRKGLLLREFAARAGDPNCGGSSRRPLVTAYRQDALRCAGFLRHAGAAKVSAVRAGTCVVRAAAILQHDVYGWFRRESRGIYGLSEKGRGAVVEFTHALPAGLPLAPAGMV